MPDSSDLAPYLLPTEFIESDHPAVADFVAKHSDPTDALRDRIVALYYAIRDGFRYTPWNVAHTREGFYTSSVLLRERSLGAHCIDKANVLAACARYLGVPARMHFANVRNHIGSEDLERLLGTDLLVYHGYTGLYLDDKWVTATPAFNRELCEHLGVDPLEFDGKTDSVFQAYDQAKGLFMEYVKNHGHYVDIPFEQMMAAWIEAYQPFGEGGIWAKAANSI